MKSRVTVIGSGFVGAATGRGLRKHGQEVAFIDTDKKRVQELRDEGLEAGLPEDHPKINSIVTMFCVPTPTDGDSINLDYLKAAVESFAKKLKDHRAYHVAAIRSTVPPGTTRKFVLPIIEKLSGKEVGKDFGLVMQPEYLREAMANDDFERPWIVAIGAWDKKSFEQIEKLYLPFDVPIVRLNLEEAEAQKYVHNLFNAVKIAWFNEVRIALRNEGMDADAIFQATAQSSEGLWNPLYGIRDFGPFDGSCLPKDTRSFLQWGEDKKYDMRILRSVVEANLEHEKILGQNEQVRVNYLANIHA